MVFILLPPPVHSPNPQFVRLPAGQRLVRIFDPTDHQQTAVSFRYNGPRRRFDHHRGFGEPIDDPERGIYYAAYTLEHCIVEIFGDTRVIDCGDKCAALLQVTRPLALLDLRGRGAMRAGSVAALAQSADYLPSQAWSRYFYENESVYTRIDGLLYYNAHNGGEALAFYERAAGAIRCDPGNVVRLDDPALRPAVQRAALQNNILPPGP